MRIEFPSKMPVVTSSPRQREFRSEILLRDRFMNERVGTSSGLHVSLVNFGPCVAFHRTLTMKMWLCYVCSTSLSKTLRLVSWTNMRFLFISIPYKGIIRVLPDRHFFRFRDAEHRVYVAELYWQLQPTNLWTNPSKNLEQPDVSWVQFSRFLKRIIPFQGDSFNNTRSPT